MADAPFPYDAAMNKAVQVLRDYVPAHTCDEIRFRYALFEVREVFEKAAIKRLCHPTPQQIDDALMTADHKVGGLLNTPATNFSEAGRTYFRKKRRRFVRTLLTALATETEQ